MNIWLLIMKYFIIFTCIFFLLDRSFSQELSYNCNIDTLGYKEIYIEKVDVKINNQRHENFIFLTKK